MSSPDNNKLKSEDNIDYDDDVAFEEALARQASQLTPGDQRQATWLSYGATYEKRKRDDEGSPGQQRITDPYRAILSTSERSRAPVRSDEAAPESLASDAKDSQEYLAAEAYKPTAFGDFSTYMRHKRMKLKVQEHSMAKDEEAALQAARRQQAGESDDASVRPSDYQARPTLFANACIYINGHTVPPYAELRRIIHLYGGELMPYLDQKTPVTHIVASNLTAKKRIEFKDYRVVRPEWITESIAQGKRLDWRDFRCTEDATGALQAGALGAQSRLNNKAGNADHEDGTTTPATSALPSDWRARAAQMAAANAEGKPALVGRTVNPLVGSNNVGPWGAASRQKSLGNWARQPIKQEKPKDSDGAVYVAEASSNDAATVKEVDRARQDADTFTTHGRTETGECLQTDPTEESELTNEGRHEFSAPDPSSTETSETPQLLANAEVRTPAKDTQRDTMLPGKYYGTDPVNPELAALNAWQNFPAHPYASRPSNSKAAQLMASPSWRERNTATGEGFLEGYFGKSRLHHLSTWKSEMREMVGQALREADRAEGSVDLPSGVRRVIMHIDFDAFFVSVGLRARPDLADKPVVVCHADSDTAGTSSTSEIASCNYKARSFGIRNGMSLGQARKFCNDVATIPYDFKAYNDIAICFYTILLSHADAIEAVSIDEALIDVSMLLQEMRQGKDSSEPARKALMSAYQGHLCSQGQQWTEEKQLAEALRDEIRAATGCEASIGIGSNVLLARIATRKAKPGGSYHLQDGDVSGFVDELDIDDLHGVGWSIRNRCKELFGTYNVGQLKTLATRSKFMAHFGDKHGVTIWDKLHGRERSRLESVKQRQSCGAAVNYAIRFKTDDEARDFVLKLCQEVSSRLQNIKLVGKVCCISLMVRSKEAPEEAPKFLGHGWCDTYNRSVPLNRATDDSHVIFENAWRLIAGLHIQPDQMRGIGVSLQKLIPKEGTGFPAKREAGQRALTFKPTNKTPEKLKSLEDQDHELNKESIEDGDAILNSPSAQRVVRLQQQDAPSKGGVHSITETPAKAPSTQFQVPSFSQLDPDVVAALPPSIQKQILAGHKEVEKREESPQPASPASSAPQTPRKQQKGKDSNLYTKLLAASTTPHRRGTPSRSQGKMVGHTSVPSTPSGSQRRARQMEWEPTWSQVDQNVLAELPDDVRDEVLRQIGRAGPSRGAAMSRTSSLPGDEDESPTKNASAALLEQKGLIGMMTRSHSESPRKRQAYLDVPGLRNRMAQPISNVKGFGPGSTTALPPILPNLGAHKGGVQAVSLVKAPDPATVTRDELVALEIDPDVFAELPLSVQRETLQQQSTAAADRKARFKTGRHAMGVTLAQQRLQQRQSATLGDAQNSLRARPIGADRPTAERTGMLNHVSKPPSIKGLSTLDEVRDLLSTWFGQFSKSGPRERDTERIARFLVECLESSGVESHHEKDTAPRTRARTRSASTRGSLNSNGPGSGAIDSSQATAIEKTYALLQWWAQLLARHTWPDDGIASKIAWAEALRVAHEQVDAAMLARYGARLSLGPGAHAFFQNDLGRPEH